MSKFEGVVVSDQSLHSQFTQVELRSLKSKVGSSHCFSVMGLLVQFHYSFKFDAFHGCVFFFFTLHEPFPGAIVCHFKGSEW